MELHPVTEPRQKLEKKVESKICIGMMESTGYAQMPRARFSAEKEKTDAFMGRNNKQQIQELSATENASQPQI